MAKAAKSKTNDQPGYTAVIYFHGMGSQRRYEESSRLIDALDQYATNSNKGGDEDLGYLREIDPVNEPSRNSDDDTVTYIRTCHFRTDKDAGPDHSPKHSVSETRVYEAYWAPIMAGSRSPMAVAKWILRQVPRPIMALLSPWRERHRLRRAALAELKERGHCRSPADTRDDDFDMLLQDYAAFEKLDAARGYPKGSFGEFKTFITKEHKDADTSMRVLRVANAWHWFYICGEVRNLFSLLTIFLTLLLIAGGLIWSVMMGLQQLHALSFMQVSGLILPELISNALPTGYNAAVALLGSVLMAFGLGRFLSNNMGDVEAWVTYEETDEKHQKRHRVLQECGDLMRHVLADDKCKRVIVVSHSLGTSVAHDTLLSLAWDNRAANTQDPISGPAQLDKIHHFITIACPIDKINYFFESTRSKFHRYLRVIDTIRGDISTVPFVKNRKPHVHWVNFWDQADIISGAIHSPVGRENLQFRVDNVHTASLNAPDPGASHAAYFRNGFVIKKLFEMIYLNEYNFAKQKLIKNEGYDCEAAMIGPGERKGLHRTFFFAAVSLPWLGLLYLVLTLAGATTISEFVLWVLLGIAAVLSIIMLAKKCQGLRRKL